jgi:DNA-binding CsgD family transcriptional regulator
MSFHEPSELYSLISGNDALKLLELIHETVASDSVEEFTSLFPKIGELFPFEYAIATLGRRDSTDKNDLVHGLNISFPKEWMKEYLSRNYFQVDAIIRENFSTYEVQNWSVKRKELCRDKEITSLGLDFGLRECWTHGSKPLAKENYGSMFCFAGKTMKQDGRTAAILEFLIPHLHIALTHIFGKKRQETGNILLSSREKEILDWLKQGKSSWEISVILGISERTVNFHVNNVMRKLDTSKRQQAVAVAVRLGLIDID